MPDDNVQSSPLTDTLASQVNSPVIPPPQNLPVPTPPDISGGPQAPAGPLGGAQQLPPRPPGTGVASQPRSKAEFFRSMLGDFFYSVGKGLSERGTGPGADARGAGAAMTALPERDVMRQQMEIQKQSAQATQALKEAQADQYTRVPVTINGQTMMLPATAAKQILAAQAGGQSREAVQGEKNTGALAVQGLKNEGAANVATIKGKIVKNPSDPLWQITKQTHPGMDPASPEFANEWESLRMKEKTDPGVKRMGILLQRSFHPFNDAAGNTVGWVNPVTRQVTMGEDIPGLQQTLAASGGVIPPKPPGQVIGMAVAAGTMLQHMPTIYKEIEDAKDKLGPAAGRWNEYMTGKVGASDPQFTKLRTDISLLQTRLMQAHVGMAGSDKMMEHFAGLIDQGRQSPENMKAAAETIESYLQTYRGMSPQATGGGGMATTPKGGGKLSENEAMSYLKNAGGDANKARAMAKKDGRTF